MMMPQQYPFAAIVGQEDMKLALILNLIDPSLGGVLIRGERGTAKSTAVRSLAQLMPRRREIAGCRFGCDPTTRRTGARSARRPPRTKRAWGICA